VHSQNAILAKKLTRTSRANVACGEDWVRRRHGTRSLLVFSQQNLRPASGLALVVEGRNGNKALKTNGLRQEDRLWHMIGLAFTMVPTGEERAGVRRIRTFHQAQYRSTGPTGILQEEAYPKAQLPKCLLERSNSSASG
jgi:hypothetical protein